MAVYDPEKNQDDLDSLTPDELSALEEKHSGWRDELRDRAEQIRSGDEDTGRGGMGRKLRLNSQKKDDEEQEALDNRLDAIKDRIGGKSDETKDDEGGGFFKNGKGGKASKDSKLGGISGGLLKNRKLLGGVGGGVVGVLIGGAMLFNFLQTFQLDNFFKFMDGRTSARLSASLDTRNRHLVKSYIKIRATEIEGNTNNDNLFFGADKVDTNKPLTDWYRTMRKSKFEKQLLDNQGIKFVTIVGPDGSIDVGRVTRKDGLSPELAKKLNDTGNDSVKLKELLNTLSDDELDQAFVVDKFDSHKAARKSVKEAVNSEVPWYRTFKRRHLRKDIANITGIKEWRLFEKTRDKIAKNKQEARDKLLNKIVDRYYKNNPASAQLMKCLFSDARCSNNNDPSSPDVKTEEAKTGATASDPENPDASDEEKAVAKEVKDETEKIGGEFTEIVEKEIAGEAVEEVGEEVVEEAAQLGFRQRLIAGLVRNLSKKTLSAAIPYNPLTYWAWAKGFAKVDQMIGDDTITKLVSNARRGQAVGLYTTYQIAGDQMKSGQLVGDELNTFFDTTKNLGNTEAWAIATGQMTAADAKASKKRQEYCKQDVSERKMEDFAWHCDDQKIGGSSNAKTIQEGYNASVGPVLGVVAGAVKTVEDSYVGKVINFAEEKFGQAIDAALKPIMEFVLEIPWVKQTLNDTFAWVIEKVMTFLGAAPAFDPGNQPGLGNFLAAGSAGSFEAATRGSGGIQSTKQSLEYTNRLAADYTTEQNSKLSVYDRYASLDNPSSFASTSLFAASNNTSLSATMGKVSSTLSSLPSMLGNVFSGRAFALSKVDGSTMADWAGVEKYDIPKACQDLDVLDPDYKAKATNAKDILSSNDIDTAGLNLDMDTLRDTDKFWNAVYEKIGDKPNAQEIAAPIYNCALFDARVMGSLGYVYGYKDDNGYEGTASQEGGGEEQPAGNANVTVIGDSYTVGMKAAGLEQKLKDKGWSPTVNAFCGRPLAGTGQFTSCDSPPVQAYAGLGAIQQADLQNAVRGSGTVVVGLGTNDLGGDENNFRANVSMMIDEIEKLNPDAKIYWTNFYLTTDKQGSVPGYNKVLTDLSSEKGFGIIDWYSNAPSNYAPGNIHPKDYNALTQLIVDSLGDAPKAGQTTEGFVWPMPDNVTISQCFAPGGHPGIDVFGGQGTDILAAGDGEVTNAGPIDANPSDDYGPNFVAIKHPNGKGTSYGHMASMTVKVGDQVKAGQKIGTEGNLGYSQGSHLHFNMFPGSYSGWDTPNIDPLENGVAIPAGVNNSKGCS